MISGVRDMRITRSPPSRFLIAAVAIVVRGHSALTAMPFVAQLAGKAEHDQAHAELGDRVGGAAGEPFSCMSSGGEIIRICGFVAFSRCGIAYFDTMKVPRVLIPMHQIEAAHVGLDDRRALDRAGIVDHDIDAAEGRDGLLDRGLHRASSRTSTTSGSALPPAFAISSAAV